MPQSLNSEILARTIDGSSIPSSVISNQHVVIHWNTALEALTGLKRNAMIGTDGQWRSFYSEKRPTLADLIIDCAAPAEIEKYYGQKCQKSPLIEGAYEAEDYFPAINPNGKWLQFNASPIKNNAGLVIGAVASCVDITKRKTAEESLRHYLLETTKAQEAERKRLSRELHDDTIQVFSSLSRQLDNFLRKDHGLSAEETTFLKDLHTQLNRGAKDLHRFCQGLRPSILDDLGLVPALRSLVKGLQEREGLKADFVVVGKVRRYPPETESILFRIIQEALNNIRQHAQATQAHVIMDFIKPGIEITIGDNGRGFETKKKIEELPRSGKLGLAGIQERVRLLNGAFDIISVPGNGTTLLIHIKV